MEDRHLTKKCCIQVAKQQESCRMWTEVDATQIHTFVCLLIHDQSLICVHNIGHGEMDSCCLPTRLPTMACMALAKWHKE